MSTLTLEETRGLAGEQSVAAQAAARGEAASPRVGRSTNPEVVAVAQRRRFSDQYKLKILSEIDANTESIGMILRREGLYSSNISRWRKWRNNMGTEKKPVSGNKRMHNELAKLQRENARLKMKLQKAEGLIELQKKTTELLNMMSRNASDES
jgi:transposase-like protein